MLDYNDSRSKENDNSTNGRNLNQYLPMTVIDQMLGLLSAMTMAECSGRVE